MPVTEIIRHVSATSGLENVIFLVDICMLVPCFRLIASGSKWGDHITGALKHPPPHFNPLRHGEKSSSGKSSVRVAEMKLWSLIVLVLGSSLLPFSFR